MFDKYTIMKVDDSRLENVLRTQDLLSSFVKIEEIDFFDGRIKDPRPFLDEKKIPIKWEWHEWDPRDTELAVWLNTINIAEFAVEKNIESILVFEDDAILDNNFLEIFYSCVNELPKDFDFLTLYAFKRPGEAGLDNQFTSETDIGAKHIHKALNLGIGTQAMLYSKSGFIKILNDLINNGIRTCPDPQIFQSQRHPQEEYRLNGYAIRDEFRAIHVDDSVPSLIR